MMVGKATTAQGAAMDDSPAKAERKAAMLGGLAGAAALFSAASCCVLPLALAAAGVGAIGLSSVVAWHWPLTLLAMAAVAAAWLLRWQRVQACAVEGACAAQPTQRAAALMLWFATMLVAASALWPLIEAPILQALGGQ